MAWWCLHGALPTPCCCLHLAGKVGCRWLPFFKQTMYAGVFLHDGFASLNKYAAVSFKLLHVNLSQQQGGMCCPAAQTAACQAQARHATDMACFVCCCC